MEYGDQKYEEAINYARKALSKPDLLNPKQTAKANAILAGSMMQIYNKTFTKPEIKSKVEAAYPNLISEVEKAIEVVENSPNAADFKNELRVPKNVLAIIYVNKAQELLKTNPTQSISLLDKSEGYFKAIGIDNPLISYMKGVAKVSVTGDENQKSAMEKSALDDFKKVILALKAIPATSKDPAHEEIKKNYAPSSYSQIISLSAKHDKSSVNTWVSEAKARYPNDEEINNSALNVQITTGSADDTEKILAQEVEKDPGNAQKALLYASTLEKKYERLKKENKSANELEVAFENALKAYTNVTTKFPKTEAAQFNAGALLYNRAVELNKAINDLPADASEAQITKFTSEKKAFLTRALPFLEAAAEINRYTDKQGLSTLISITSELELTEKFNMYDAKKKAIK